MACRGDVCAARPSARPLLAAPHGWLMSCLMWLIAFGWQLPFTPMASATPSNSEGATVLVRNRLFDRLHARALRAFDVVFSGGVDDALLRRFVDLDASSGVDSSSASSSSSSLSASSSAAAAPPLSSSSSILADCSDAWFAVLISSKNKPLVLL